MPKPQISGPWLGRQKAIKQLTRSVRSTYIQIYTIIERLKLSLSEISHADPDFSVSHEDCVPSLTNYDSSISSDIY
jgi:hypothetical protein